MQNILVTGASSGIGLKTAQLLANNGFQVFAGARKSADLEFLHAIPNITGIRLDVCEPQDLDNLVKKLTENGKGLFGVVNNAGIGNLGLIFTHTIEALKRVFEVNLFGMCRVITAVLPFLMKSKGRIVNISSINGFLTRPSMGAYCMSKHAVEAYSDALHFDLAENGIKVSIIEPGSFHTKIAENAQQNIISQGVTDRLFVTQAEFDKWVKANKEVVEYFGQRPEPDIVAEAILDALTSDTPKRRYLVADIEQTTMVLDRMFQEIGQLNEKPKNSLNRKELIALLDKYLTNPD